MSEHGDIKYIDQRIAQLVAAPNEQQDVIHRTELAMFVKLRDVLTSPRRTAAKR